MARKYAKGFYKVKNGSKYIGTNSPKYRSSWEFNFMQFCDDNISVVHWASESIRIPYKHPFTGKPTIYIPDFFIVYVDREGKQHSELIEIKPEKQTVFEQAKKSSINKEQWVINQAKWSAAQAWCANKGIRFRVITEKDIFYQGTKK